MPAATKTSGQENLSGLFLEAYRLRLMRGVEGLLADGGYPLVAGVDEAGRGCLAGPVVAAAVVINSSTCALIPGIDDSKRLSAAKREELAAVIRDRTVSVASGVVSAEIIDQINILQATRLAMRRALQNLVVRPEVALIDAVSPGTDVPNISMVRGDSMSYAIACASIIAKTERDRCMVAMAGQFPGYGFASNKGYGSRAHLEALAELGPSPIHRLTFRSVVPRVG